MLTGVDAKPMERIPEPELMIDPSQAAAYAAADFETAHRGIIEQFGQVFPGIDVTGPVIDLGCGPADITVRFARRYRNCRIEGIDGSEAMLILGRQRVAREGLGDRVQLFNRVLPDARLKRNAYSTIVSNSLLHHLHDPLLLWTTVMHVARIGARVYIADLRRPATKCHARGLVQTYAGGEPQILQQDFYNSLLAAFTLQEVKMQLKWVGLNTLEVESISDRHLIVYGRLT